MHTHALAATFLLCLATSCSEGSRVGRARPAIAAEPLAVDFGAVKAGTARTLPVTLVNEGQSILTFAGTRFRGGARGAFTAGALPAQLAPGERVAVELTYTAPALEGADGAQWIVQSDANNAPELAVSVSGRADRACAAGLVQCGTACVDTQADPANCGGCDTACTAPDRCVAGACTCIRRTCAVVGECGTADDGCGGTLDCGGCAGQSTCQDHRCIPPTCSDGLQNQGETDVDCGGPCPRCVLGQRCAARADCVGGLTCTAGVCSACTANAQCATDQVCRDGRCGECQSRLECGDGRACLAGRCLGCPDEAAFNDCGLCGGPLVSGVGASCLLPNDCTSTWVCDPDQTRVTCAPRVKNDCGLCDGPAITPLGGTCSAPVSGCTSALACNSANTDTVCTEIPRNACGLCAGPAITGLGDSCTLPNGCPSTQVCDAQQSGVTCAPVEKNACGVCGGVEVTGKGDACTLDNGCQSTLACNAAGDGTVCTDVQKNACQLCGGPALADLGAACTGSNGCPGTQVCNGTGDGTTCDAPATCYIAQHVVISQLCGYGPLGNTDDFIELYNPTTAEVDVSGYTLWYRNVTNGTSWVSNSVIPQGTKLAPRGYLLGAYGAVGATYSFTSVPPNFTFNFNMAAEGGQLLLWKDNTTPPATPLASNPKYVDFVGFGGAVQFETAPVTLNGGEALLRRPGPFASASSLHATTGADRTRGNGMDTDNNSADFVAMTPGTFRPRNASTTATP